MPIPEILNKKAMLGIANWISHLWGDTRDRFNIPGLGTKRKDNNGNIKLFLNIGPLLLVLYRFNNLFNPLLKCQCGLSAKCPSKYVIVPKFSSPNIHPKNSKPHKDNFRCCIGRPGTQISLRESETKCFNCSENVPTNFLFGFKPSRKWRKYPFLGTSDSLLENANFPRAASNFWDKY